MDIIFDPVKHQKYRIDCYFSTDKHLAYRTLLSEGKSSTVKHSRTSQCFYCSTYFIWKSRYDRRIGNCSRITEIVYKFHNKNLVTFEDNLKHRCDISFVAYCDFETATTSRTALFPENIEMFAISYAIISALHPYLN